MSDDQQQATPLRPADPTPDGRPDNQVFLDDVRTLMSNVTYREGYEFEVEIDKTDAAGRVFLQLKHWRPDANTGVEAWGSGGKRYLSQWMTASEVMRVALGAALAYEEHEVREFFRYDDRAIFGPHIDIEALWRIADELDVRQ